MVQRVVGFGCGRGWALQLWLSWSQAVPVHAVCVLQWHSLPQALELPQKAAASMAFAPLWVALLCWQQELPWSDAQRARNSLLRPFLAQKTCLSLPSSPCLRAALVDYMSRSTRERHAITWTSKDQIKFEMPTGGYAIMNKGENLCYFRKKEQCIALGKQLRKMKIENYKIYRLKKDGTVIFMPSSWWSVPREGEQGSCSGEWPTFHYQGQPSAVWAQVDEVPHEVLCILAMRWLSLSLSALNKMVDLGEGWCLVWGGVWRHLKFVQDQLKPDVSCFWNLHPSCKSWFSKEADPLTTLFIKARCIGLRGCPQSLCAATAKHGRAGASGRGGQVHKQEYTTRLMEAGQI